MATIRLDKFCDPSGTLQTHIPTKFIECDKFRVIYEKESTNSRQALFHAFMYALYPVFALMSSEEQRKFCRESLEFIGYAVDRDRFYERFKLSHLARKSELQNKFLQFEDVTNDRAMLTTIVNYFDVNIIILSPHEETTMKIIPTTFSFERKGCIVLHKRQNKYYPYVSTSGEHNFVSPIAYDDIEKGFAMCQKRLQYKLKPYYTYKINDLLEIAKQFHVICTKPGRYNKVVNKTKKELYNELVDIL